VKESADERQRGLAWAGVGWRGLAPAPLGLPQPLRCHVEGGGGVGGGTGGGAAGGVPAAQHLKWLCAPGSPIRISRGHVKRKWAPRSVSLVRPRPQKKLPEKESLSAPRPELYAPTALPRHERGTLLPASCHFFSDRLAHLRMWWNHFG
jgi:hypothetical protein